MPYLYQLNIDLIKNPKCTQLNIDLIKNPKCTLRLSAVCG